MTRYAIYVSPAAGPLAAAAAHWLGRDAPTGAVLQQPNPALHAVTRSAARYGFHATIGAPMRPLPDLRKEDLITALDAFCADQTSVTLDGLAVASLDGFLALVPEGPVEALNALASAVVEHFAPLRAPLTDAEMARRNPDALTPRQRQLLDRYGYPYVLDEFRFHMTLTDRLTAAQEAVLRPMAEALVLPHVPRPLQIDSLVLCAEDETGLFHHVHRAFLA